MNRQLFAACLLLAVGVIQARSTFKRHHKHVARQTSEECSEGRVKCANSERCISQSWICDGHNDCGDNSDEPATCPQRTCEEGYFKCAVRNRCVHMSSMCDGYDNCGDNSDEPEDCSTRECPEGYLKCKSGQCINKDNYCSHWGTCNDGTPLWMQADCPDVTCDPGSSKCAHLSQCISDSEICNGFSECSDGSDEPDSCRDRQCPDGQLKCDSGQCIDKDRYCEGRRACNDGTALHTQTVCPDLTCEPGYTKCLLLTMCLHDSSICDGSIDCGDMSDEPPSCRERVCEPGQFKCASGQCFDLQEYCTSEYYWNACADGTSMATACVGFDCPDGFYNCQTDGRCVANRMLCDGERQCRDGSDELAEHCSLAAECHPGSVSCPTTRQCVGHNLVCDGQRDDCRNNTDENPEFCGSRICHHGEVKCDNGQCLDKNLFCVEQMRCSDSSVQPTDDICPTTVICPAGQTQCPGQRLCISEQYLCDGDNDCGDHSDEDPALCSSRSCEHDEVRCNNGQCLDRAEFCLRFISCRDGSTQRNNDTCPDREQFYHRGDPAMDCIQSMGRRAERCVRPLQQIFVGLSPEQSMQHINETHLREFCAPGLAAFECFADGYASCSGFDHPIVEFAGRMVATARTALNYVCSRVDVINRHKSCLMQTNASAAGYRRREPMLRKKVNDECIEELYRYNPNREQQQQYYNGDQPICFPRTTVACAKRVVSEQCGDEIAEVLQGLDDRVFPTAKCPAEPVVHHARAVHHGLTGNRRRGLPFSLEEALNSFF